MLWVVESVFVNGVMSAKFCPDWLEYLHSAVSSVETPKVKDLFPPLTIVLFVGVGFEIAGGVGSQVTFQSYNIGVFEVFVVVRFAKSFIEVRSWAQVEISYPEFACAEVIVHFVVLSVALRIW